MIFSKLFGKSQRPQTTAPALEPDWQPPFIGAVKNVPPLPDGDVWWQIETHPTRAPRRLLGDVVHLPEDWDQLRQLRIADFHREKGGHGAYDATLKPVDFYRLKPDHLPRTYSLKNSAPKALPEFSSIHGFNVVSSIVKEIIKGVTGQYFNFISFSIFANNSEKRSFFYWQPECWIECVDPDLSRFGAAKREDGSIYRSRTSERYPMILRQELIAGMDVLHTFHGWFFSDRLKRELADYLGPEAVLVETRALSETQRAGMATP